MAPTALLSVSDKAGLVPLARGLQEQHGFDLLSSGGTAGVLEDAGLQTVKVADHTGAPEILGGRVKTLHPRVHGGILADRGKADHQAELAARNISPIDVVVVNLYPFQATVAAPGVSWEEAIETIDIGGPAMVRAAAKNSAHVSVLTSPAQYDGFLAALAAGAVNEGLRRNLALAAFRHTADYDRAISDWLANQLEGVSPLSLALPHRQTLRYGENPHQRACWYSDTIRGWGAAQQVQGKALSFNNLIDLDAALASLRLFPQDQPVAVVVKHTTPCGVAIGHDGASALRRAIDADAISAFGGIVAVNHPVDEAAALQLTSLFLECVVAPAFTDRARELLATRQKLRLLELSPAAISAAEGRRYRTVLGGLLAQDSDDEPDDTHNWRCVTEVQPDEDQMEDLRFAWRVVRHVRSNAIVVACDGQSLGIGAGQMNRVGSARIALEAAGEQARGAVLASDGFFPFADTVELAAGYGIRAVIQPGGSRRDADSIAACNALGLAMVCTGRRHFLH